MSESGSPVGEVVPIVTSPATGTPAGQTIGIRGVTLLVVAILFVAANATPAIDFNTRYDHSASIVYWGWEFLILGWLAVLLGQFSWIANVLLLCAFVCIATRNRLPALIFSIFAVLVTADLLALNSSNIPRDEGGSDFLLVHHVLIGCWLWVASILAALTGSVAFWWTTPTRQPSLAGTPPERTHTAHE
jgi:hypothetical protein